ncbi:hypothetical protein LEN26_001307 [Aphanomyces euteiches]|nr:hypothetical protein LEN26_001307 [Aphanomyces euteiches]KAH9197456.1 hypothetical protein AeNC1_000563 [Aphanomyces euteiches]
MSNEALGYMVMPHEAEYMIENLTRMTLQDMGSSEFMRIHHDVEKLNLQTHQSAKQKSDNFVVESLLTFKKLDVLIENMLVNELWKEQVFPTLQDISDTASLRIYFVLYHEAVLCNLLEVAFYHEHVIESLDDETLMEVIDYAMRKVTWLISTPRGVFRTKTTFHKSGKDIVQELDKASRQEELHRQRLEMEFRLAIQCVTILRYICERIHILSLNILSRLLDKHDVLLSFVALIENPPWTYKTETNEWKKFQDQKWVYVEPCDLLQVTTTEAQPWIAVYFLVCSKASRDQYQLTSFRKNQVLRIRKYLNDVMLDQLPLLADVQRFLDELAIVQLNPNTVSSAAKLVMEIVPVFRTALLRQYKNDYTKVGQEFTTACASINRHDDMKQLAEVYNMAGIDELLDGANTSQPQATNNEVTPESVIPDVNPNKPHSVNIVITNCSQKIVELGSEDEITIKCSVDASTEKLVETTDGMYFRYTMHPSSAESSIVVPPHALVHATISFESSKNLINLQNSDLQLPVGSAKPVWRQVGTLEESKGVVQMQFKIEYQQYVLGLLFVSIAATMT